MNQPTQPSKPDFSVIPPKIKPRDNFYIPADLFDAIVLHIAKNSLGFLQAPLMLILQGPKGEGKSAMTREVCSRIGVNVVALSGAMLSGVYEKEPILILRDAYLHASALWEVKNQLVVLLIDDLDTSIAAVHTERRYTVNTQLLNGALLYLCDDPYHVGEQPTQRIPVVATGNDFTTLHEPLTRHGRAQFYDWKPNLAVKVEIVRKMFDGFIVARELERIDQLVKHFNSSPSEPIAFYHALRNALYDKIILQDIHTRRTIDIAHLNSLISQQEVSLAIGDLIELGEQQRNSKPRSYLGEDGKLGQ